MKKSCVIYATWADQILNLPNDIAGEYIKYILKYAIYGEELETDNPFITAMLVPVKKKLDEDNEKYQAQVARAKTISKRSRDEVDTKSRDVEGDTVTDTVTDTDKYKKKKAKKKSTFHNFPEREYDFKALAGGSDV